MLIASLCRPDAAAAVSGPGHPVAQLQHTYRAATPSQRAGRAVKAASGATEVGYIPCDVAHAYGLNPNGLNGAGTTIAIVVGHFGTSLGIDLHVFDSTFGLGDPVYNDVAPFGRTGVLAPGVDWSFEATQDAEWAHAVAPGAAIDIVEANTDQPQSPQPQNDLLATTLWAAQNLHPDVVVLPWGTSEANWAAIYGNTFESTFNGEFFPASNGAGRPVTYLAPTGEGKGFETTWPAVATTVVGVGRTSLAPQAFGYSAFPSSHFDCSQVNGPFGVTQANETVWGTPACSPTLACSGTGGGASAFEAQPAWQQGVAPGSNRVSPDVAMLGDPQSAVATYVGGTWSGQLRMSGGISPSLWAGVAATLDQERRLTGQPGVSVGSTTSWVYSASAGDFNDVVKGSSPPTPNDPCIASGACVAAAGYDQVTGRGSPLVPALVADLGGVTSPPPGSANVPDAIADSSGHGYVAARRGGVTFGAPGLIANDGDTAMSFDGSSGYIQAPDQTSLQGGNARSVELWLSTTSTGQQQIFDASGSGTAGRAFQLGLTQSGGVGGSPSVNTPGLYLSLTQDDVYLPNLSLTDGHPHHVVVTLSGTSASLYVDGATPNGLVWNGSSWSGSQSQPFTVPTAPNTAASPFSIGHAAGGVWGTGSSFFQGTLDEVAVYDHALTTARVTQHFTAGGLAYRLAVLADSPTAYYRLDDRVGSIADSSGHQNSAAWNGGVSFGAPGLAGDSDTAMGFDGATGYVQGPSLAPLQGDNTRSVELWFSTTSTGQQTLFDSGNLGVGGQSFVIALTQSGGVIGGNVPHNTPGVFVNFFGNDVYLPDQNLGDGKPHHLVLTLTGSSVTVFVDGKTPSGAVSTNGNWSALGPQPLTLPSTPNTAANPVWIGHARFAPQNAGSVYFTGTIDEVAIYDHALTSARVNAHLTAGTGYRSAVLADSPIAYYRLDDRSSSIADSSTSHLSPAAWNGGVGFGAAGLVGDGDAAMSFDGSTGYIQAPDQTSLQGGNARSMELWLSTTSTGQQQIIEASGNSGAGRAFQLGLTQSGGIGGSPSVNTPGLYLNLVGDDVYLPNLSLTDGRPHHVVVTLSGTSVSLYVDGATPNGLIWNGTNWSGSQPQPFTLPTAPNTTPGPLLIGHAGYGVWGTGSVFFQGTLDEVAIYDHALTAARVNAHLTAGSTYRSAVLTDAPVAYYRLDDRVGSVADSSGHVISAAWNGGVSFGAPGLVGDSDTAMSFDGATGYVQGPSVAPLQGGNTRSVELWFSTTSTGQQVLLDGGNWGVTAQSFMIALTQSGGVSGSNVPHNTPGVYANFFGDDIYIPDQNLGDGRPHHLVLTLSGSSVSIYVDGKTPSGAVIGNGPWSALGAQPFTLPFTPSTAANPLWIGHARGAPDGVGSTYLTGTIDEVAVYDHALTSARVNAHLTAGSGYRSVVLADTPVAYYRLDDVSS